VADAGIRKTAMILVGRALDKAGGAESLLYAAGFSHGYRRGEKR
jgi:precorrin-4 methylase